jgi:hypothetical protein
MKLNRRDFLIGGTAFVAGTSVTAPFFLPKYRSYRPPKRSRVAVLKADQYSSELVQLLATGLREFPIAMRGKRVVLKPNLVDYLPGDAVNTHPILVRAAAEAFRAMGAKSVVVAEGPRRNRCP